jgi:hypothetical protein
VVSDDQADVLNERVTTRLERPKTEIHLFFHHMNNLKANKILTAAAHHENLSKCRTTYSSLPLRILRTNVDKSSHHLSCQYHLDTISYLIPSNESLQEIQHVHHSPASSCTAFKRSARERAMLGLLRCEASQVLSWAAVLWRVLVGNILGL